MVAIVPQFDFSFRHLSSFSAGVRTWFRGSNGFGLFSICVRSGCWPVCLGLLFWVAAAEARAQSEGAPTAAPPNGLLNPLPDVLSEGTLQRKARLWLSDRDGNKVLVPEEFAEDYFSSRGQSASGGMGLPPATLEHVDVQAEVVGEVARVTGRFSAVLTQDFATTIPLAFGTVQLTETSYSGVAGQNRLMTVRDDPGWRWVVLGEPNSTHTATLTGVARVDSDQERRSLRISLPTAPCKLRIKLPDNADDLRVRSDDVLQRQDSAEGGVVVEVSCRGGEFLLSWRDRTEVTEVAAILANSSTRFEIVDPTQPWLATTTINIRWHGRDAASQLRLALPSGGQWRELPNSDMERYTIQAEVDESTETDSTSGEREPPAPEAAMPLLLSNFDITRNESLEIELEWEWMPTILETESAATEVKLQTPVVLGVDQHTGIIDCVVTSAYAVVFKEGAGAQLIYQAPLAEFARHQLQFKFDRQPYDLNVVFRREQSLPTIRPTYLVNVDSNKLTLTMWFDCSFDTNQPQMELGLMLDEWVIQENTARMVPDSADPFSNEGEILQVMQQVDRNYVIRSATGPANNYGGTRHVDQLWRLVAERAWTAEDHELYFQVPRIIRGRVNGNPEIDHGAGALLVSSQSNVLLTWQEAAGTGLQRDSFSTEYQRFVGEHSPRKPMVYRFQSSETTPRWAGRAELLPRQVTVEQQANVEVIQSQVAVAQLFKLQVANEPLGEVRFAVRKDIADTQLPQVLINGQLVSAQLVGSVSEQELEAQMLTQRSVDPAAADTAGSSVPVAPSSKGLWQVYQTRGAPESLGATQLEIRSIANWKWSDSANPTPARGSSEATESAAAQETKQIAIPLVQLLLPADAQWTRQSFALQTDAQVEAVVTDSTPVADGSSASDKRSGILQPTQKLLVLDVRPRRLIGLSPVRIEVAWLQSFVNSQKRRERFVARIESTAQELQLKLPRAANIREGLVKVSVNGLKREISYDSRTDIVTIPLNGGQNNVHVVEIAYFLPDSLSWITVLNVTPPEIVGAEQAEQFYWQLLTPAVHHLGWSPRELTAEWTWQWGGLCWQRASQLDQRQLEELIGAQAQEPPPASANSYVMSARGAGGLPKAWVLSRFILWFPVGLLAIAISFTALNFAVVRKPIVVFAMAVAITGLAMIWPDLAALAGQTALLSLGLVALVWVVQAAVDSRVRRRSVFSTRPSTYMDRSEHLTLARSGRAQPAAQLHGSSTGTGGG